MKYFIGHLSFRLLCLALTIACFSLPVFSQKSEKAVQDTIKNKTSNEKYLQTSAVSTIRYSDLDKASASNLENALTYSAFRINDLTQDGRRTGKQPLGYLYTRYRNIWTVPFTSLLSRRRRTGHQSDGY